MKDNKEIVLKRLLLDRVSKKKRGYKVLNKNPSSSRLVLVSKPWGSRSFALGF